MSELAFQIYCSYCLLPVQQKSGLVLSCGDFVCDSCRSLLCSDKCPACGSSDIRSIDLSSPTSCPREVSSLMTDASSILEELFNSLKFQLAHYHQIIKQANNKINQLTRMLNESESHRRKFCDPNFLEKNSELNPNLDYDANRWRPNGSTEIRKDSLNSDKNSSGHLSLPENRSQSLAGTNVSTTNTSKHSSKINYDNGEAPYTASHRNTRPASANTFDFDKNDKYNRSLNETNMNRNTGNDSHHIRNTNNNNNNSSTSNNCMNDIAITSHSEWSQRRPVSSASATSVSSKINQKRSFTSHDGIRATPNPNLGLSSAAPPLPSELTPYERPSSATSTSSQYFHSSQMQSPRHSGSSVISRPRSGQKGIVVTPARIRSPHMPYVSSLLKRPLADPPTSPSSTIYSNTNQSQKRNSHSSDISIHDDFIPHSWT